MGKARPATILDVLDEELDDAPPIRKSAPKRSLKGTHHQFATDNQKFVNRIRQFNSLSQSDFQKLQSADSPDPAPSMQPQHQAFAKMARRNGDSSEEADVDSDEVEVEYGGGSGSNYEEQVRRRSDDRRLHRQAQRRGSLEDYEQTEDVQFVNRIQNFNSLTGQQIQNLRSGRPEHTVIVRPKPPAPAPKPTSPPGHTRKTTLDSWKDQAAKLKDMPAFPPHRNSSCSANPNLGQKQAAKKSPVLTRSGTFKRISSDGAPQRRLSEDEASSQFTIGISPASYPEEEADNKSGSHQRKETLQEWKSRAAQEQLTRDYQHTSVPRDFNQIEDQSWTTSVVTQDTLKRFKQQQLPSITDLFNAGSGSDHTRRGSDLHKAPIEEEDFDNDGEEASETEQTDGPSFDTKLGRTRTLGGDAIGSWNELDIEPREMIRECLRVIARLSRSGAITSTQKAALKNLVIRKDPRVLKVAYDNRDNEASEPMEAAMAKLAIENP
ncbi:Uncharacterized protein PBTT_06717 [Plasmodiophora brassicae]|uniref:Uncharacterized protein n=1 Tax=Plasmodiophora brassicae TaxID=37360 RepID=A0A3P3YB57_PLABS|nr:unnamed protein product [Plasmodiophora brassicae]